MKVLMLHDCSFVGFELSKELKRIGVEVEQLNYFDKLGVSFMKGLNITKMLVATVRSDVDLVHSHFLGTASVVAFLSGRPYVVHVHGSDVRNKNLTTVQKTVLKHARAILYATSDLKKRLPRRSIYLPTPVGSQFKNLNLERTFKTAYKPVSYEKTIKCNLFLRYFRYDEMPKILNTVETFIDRYSVPSLSKTALEALACGCVVVKNGKKLKGLPPEHKARNVALRLYEIYEKLTKCNH